MRLDSTQRTELAEVRTVANAIGMFDYRGRPYDGVPRKSATNCS